MKTKKKLFLFNIIFISLINVCSYSQGIYFHDADFVYLRNGNPDYIDSIAEFAKRTIYWDLSSIDTNANRLDICIGYNELNSGPATDYLWSNWLKNEDDVNFNTENPNLRFIYG
jgi:hypothetical protein